MLVRTLKGHSYARYGRKQGEEYHIDNIKHAKLLQAVGKIRIIPEKVKKELVQPPTRPTTKIKKESAEKSDAKKTDETKEKTEKVAKSKASSYSRKDMIAEDAGKSSRKKSK